MDKAQLLQKLTLMNLPPTEYWLVAGGAMVLYGLRETTADLDLGCTTSLADELERRGCPTFRMEDGTRRISLNDQCELFENWLYDRVEMIEGVPVISLQGLLTMKKRLGREKDRADIEKIQLALLERKDVQMMQTIYCYHSPIGPLRLVGSDEGLTHILLPGQTVPEDALDGETPLLRRAALELKEYFSGRRKSFTVNLCPSGTPFQMAVWAALQTIPYGQTVSYKDIAAQIGKPAAVRAVGGANGKNPIPILIPCHRVVAADGSLGGYALGPEIKRTLLALEGALLS